MSTRGEDVVWVDYDAAVSMHRVLKVKERLESLASPTKADNRMSFGCINLPPRFYEEVLRPAVDAGGAVIYVLPETRPLRDTFASFYDVTAACDRTAVRKPSGAARGSGRRCQREPPAGLRGVRIDLDNCARHLRRLGPVGATRSVRAGT